MSTTERPTSTARSVLLATAAAAVVSIAINWLIALAATAAGADQTVVIGLTPPAFILFTVVGVLAAAVVWATIRSRAAHPAAVLRWLVPTVVALSLIPDLLVGLTLSWGGALALALMHIAVAVVAVATFRRFLPLPR